MFQQIPTKQVDLVARAATVTKSMRCNTGNRLHNICCYMLCCCKTYTTLWSTTQLVSLFLKQTPSHTHTPKNTNNQISLHSCVCVARGEIVCLYFDFTPHTNNPNPLRRKNVTLIKLRISSSRRRDLFTSVRRWWCVRDRCARHDLISSYYGIIIEVCACLGVL